MTKSSIRPEGADTAPVAALVPVTSNAVAVPAYYDASQYDDVSRDIEVPVVGLINKVGPLSKKFPKNTGEFAFGDQFVLGEQVTVIPIAIMKYFVERFRNGAELKYGSPEATTAKTFRTAQEAAQAGYYVDFESSAPNRVEEASRVAYLVVASTKSDEFTLDAAGVKLALAKSSYQRGSHRGVFRPLLNHAVKYAQMAQISTVGKNATTLFEEAQAYSHYWTLSAEHKENVQRQQDWFETRISRGDTLPLPVKLWVTENYNGFRI